MGQLKRTIVWQMQANLSGFSKRYFLIGDGTPTNVVEYQGQSTRAVFQVGGLFRIDMHLTCGGVQYPLQAMYSDDQLDFLPPLQIGNTTRDIGFGFKQEGIPLSDTVDAPYAMGYSLLMGSDPANSWGGVLWSNAATWLDNYLDTHGFGPWNYQAPEVPVLSTHSLGPFANTFDATFSMDCLVEFSTTPPYWPMRGPGEPEGEGEAGALTAIVAPDPDGNFSFSISAANNLATTAGSFQIGAIADYPYGTTLDDYKAALGVDVFSAGGGFSPGACNITASLNGTSYRADVADENVDMARFYGGAQGFWFPGYSFGSDTSYTGEIVAHLEDLDFWFYSEAAGTSVLSASAGASVACSGQPYAGMFFWGGPVAKRRILGDFLCFTGEKLDSVVIEYTKWRNGVADGVGFFLAPGGHADYTWTQLNFDITWMVFWLHPRWRGIADISRNTIGPIECWVQQGQFEVTGDTELDRQLWSHGRRYDAVQIAALADRDLCSDSTFLNWTAINGALSAGGLVTLTASSTDASATAHFGAVPLSMESHRHLRVEWSVVGADNVPLQLTIAGKQWNLPGGGSGVGNSVLIDLCCPESAGSGMDDMRWPLDRPTLYPIAQGAFNTGVNWASTIQISGLPNGCTLEVTKLRLTVKTAVTMDVLQTFGKWDVIFPVALPTFPWPTLGERYILIQTDHRQSAELHSFESYAGIVTTQHLSDIVAELNSIPGWSASLMPPVGDGIGDIVGGPSSYLAGFGATYDGAAFKVWQDIDITAGVVIPLQELLWVIDAYPGMGFWMNGTGEVYPTDGPLTFTFQKFLRGCAHGLITDPVTGQPVAGQKVTLKRQPDLLIEGSGTTGTDGYARTALPCAHALDLCKVTPGKTLVQQMYQRRKSRFAFQVKGKEGAANFQSPDGQYHRVMVSGGDAYYLRSPWTVPYVAFEQSTALTTSQDAATPRVAVGHMGRIWAGWYQSGTNLLYEAYSDDNGATFSVPVTSAGTRCAKAVDAEGNLVRGRFAGGHIYVSFQGRGDGAAAAEVLATGADDDSFSLCRRRGPEDEWRLCFVSGGNAHIVSSRDDCQTWGTAVEVLVGITNPVIWACCDGALGMAAQKAGRLVTAVLHAGASAWDVTAAALDSEGTMISIEDDGIGLAEGFDGTGRLVAVLNAASDQQASEWVSTDYGKTFTKLPVVA